MKRIASLAVLIALIMILGIYPAFCLDTSLKVYDDAGLFNGTELSDLQSKAQGISERNNIDVVVLTINDAEGKSSMAYADDYYDYNGFGYGDDKSGLLMLIDMDNRKVWISTRGRAISYFTDTRINSMLDSITPYLSDEEYAEGADTFLNLVENVVTGQASESGNGGVSAGPYSNGETTAAETNKVEKSAQHILIYLLVAIGVAGIAVGIMSINNRGKKTTNPGTYLDPNSFILNDNRDIYIRTAVTKRLIQSNSGGGSSTHSGSSGATHGGGGRSF